MINQKECRSCHRVLNEDSLLKLPNMPGAVQNLPTDRGTAIASGVTLDVRQCSNCGLVQLTNEPVPYYKDVIRAGSFSPSMIKRQKNEFKTFIEKFSLQGKNVLEIGSGRGEYLSILNELPVNAYGLEHNPEYNRIANEKGLKTFQGYPTDFSGPFENIIFDAFISINFLEHAPDPGAFLRSSSKLLSENGVGLIAVPDFEFELQDNFLFSFMSDHLLYFSADSLANTLAINAFEVIDVFRNKKLNVVTAYVKKREKFDLSQPQVRFQSFNHQINDYINSMLNNGKRVALWGASHLAFSIVAASKTEDRISYIVDSAPFKQGKFSPATGLEIFSPQHLLEDPVESIIIMCPEYSNEIVADIQNRFSEVVSNIATFVNGELKIVYEKNMVEVV